MSKHWIYAILPAGLFAFPVAVPPVAAGGDPHLAGPTPVATFSIVARDSVSGELGVAVASRFFAVGSVVPWARAGVGAVATQSFANTSFGWRGLDLLSRGASAQEALSILLRADANPEKRQVGIVGAKGPPATHTGAGCLAWAGGRVGTDYAVQGNILAGEQVVVRMEQAFLQTRGSLAERLYAALLAGDSAGGDARGKQSAALLLVREGAGYGGYTDRAIDIRVDDHPEPFRELGRLLRFGLMNYAWNEGWTLFTRGRPGEALPPMKRAATLAPENPEVLYDLAVISLSAGKTDEALDALATAVRINPGLARQAEVDGDLDGLRPDPRFAKILSGPDR